MITFSLEQVKLIYEDARKRYPEECCGILLGERSQDGRRTVKDIYRADNTAEQKMRNTHFMIHPEAVLRAELLAAKNQYEIVGVYHSHVNCEARASEEDGRFALPDISYPIVSVWDRQIRELSSWEKKGPARYEGLAEEQIEIKR